MAKINYEEYTKDDLIRLIRERDRKPKFGLVWERDEIDHDKSLNDDFVVLDHDTNLSVGAAPYQNLIIEGDNFDALRYLKMTYSGKVKCIYVDPPYNTGNKDFIYNDHFVDAEDQYKHSKWLEYLYRRFSLAKDLLREDGVMLVSINDENRAKLELMLDQVLPGMRAGSFTWRTRTAESRNNGINFSNTHEHVLIYAKPLFRFSGMKRTFAAYKKKDGNRMWRSIPITVPADYKARPNQFYPILDKATDIWYPCNPNRVWAYSPSVLQRDFEETGKLLFPSKPKFTIWNSKQELLDAIANDEVPLLDNGTKKLWADMPNLDFFVGKKVGWGSVDEKRYADEVEDENQPISSWIRNSSEDSVDVEFEDAVSQMTSEGSKSVSEILGSKSFTFAKPPSLLKLLVAQSSTDDDVVLDFFAGSGTTAHATLLANVDDEAKRRFIMVSSTEATTSEPEKNICRDVCSMRVAGVMKGYSGLVGTGGSFAYIRTKRIPLDQVLHCIKQEQIWLALQLIHLEAITPFIQEKHIQVAGDDGEVAYISKITEESMNEAHAIASSTAGNLTIYSWQPGILRQHIQLPNVTFENIPQYLVDRFSVGAAR
jgi:adenine-specific DNA-methyltransferase